jgi:hypothetical protein
MYRVYLRHIYSTDEKEFLPIEDTGLEYSISKEINGNFTMRFSRYSNTTNKEDMRALIIRPKGKISPVYSFIGDFVNKNIAITYNASNPDNISEAYIIDDSYVNNANKVELAMLRLGYPSFTRIDNPNMSQIKLELTGRDALKIKDIIITDKEGNIVISCKYGRSWFYNYKNELPWYCDFSKATLEDVLSVAANVNKLKMFQPDLEE